METFLKNLGNILSILGIIITCYLYIKAKSKKEIVYVITNFNLIKEDLSQKFSGLKISYKSKDVNHLSVSKIAICNSGNSTISKEEIPVNNKIKVNICDNYEILEYQLIQNEDANDSEINITKVDDKNLEINFNFLEPKKGFVIKLIHTSSSSNDISIKGRIIGGSGIKRINDVGKHFMGIEHFLFKYCLFFMGLSFILSFLFNPSSEFGFFYFLLFIFGVFSVIIALNEITEKKLPKKIEKIYLSE